MSDLALVVAEKSVLSVVEKSLTSLFQLAEIDRAAVVVPARQLSDFARLKSPSIEVVAEDDVIPGHISQSIAARLGARQARTGWYLQQFVKLGFCKCVEAPRYVIWDADTVLLQPMSFFRDGRLQLATAKEHHRPYFETFERLMGARPALRSSAISQYMPVDVSCAKEMLERIEGIHNRHWIDAILSVLPLQGDSEFSEYETLANYMALSHPDKVSFVRHRWFRYGSDICGFTTLPEINEVAAIFSGYAYVAFERHPHSALKRKLLWLMLKLGISS